MSTRRDLLAALVALAATPALAQAAQQAEQAELFPTLDKDAVRRIGEAWRKTHPDATARSLAAKLFPNGRGSEALATLRRAVAQDFHAGAVFNHRGWRLSNTEGALFALLSLET